MSHSDGGIAHAQVIDQPLKTINELTFSNVSSYGQGRINAVLDHAVEAGVPEAVIEEGKRWAGAQIQWIKSAEKGKGLGNSKDSDERDRRLLGGFADWFKRNFTSAESLPGTQKFTVTLPIFVLGSPEVKKSKVSMLLTSQTKRHDGFQLMVFGSGLGADKACGVTVAEEELCKNGMGRRGNLEVPIVATPVGFKLSSGPQVAWWNCSKDDSAHGRLIIDDCSEDELTTLSSKHDGDDIDLRNSSATKKFTKTVEIGTSGEFSFGVKKSHDLNATIKMRLETAQEIRYAFEFPGKHRYRPYAPTEGVGTIWRVV